MREMQWLLHFGEIARQNAGIYEKILQKIPDGRSSPPESLWHSPALPAMALASAWTGYTESHTATTLRRENGSPNLLDDLP